MVVVRCRQCGEPTRLPDFHGVTTIVCPRCRWHEIYPARRHLTKKLAHQASAAFEAHQHHDAVVADLIEGLAGLSPAAFERFCAKLFELHGKVVSEADASVAQSHGLEIREGHNKTYVACKRVLGHDDVDREEVENLAGSMRRDGVGHGLFVTTGSFTDAAREVARTGTIELIDSEGLRQLVESVDLGKLLEEDSPPE